MLSARTATSTTHIREYEYCSARHAIRAPTAALHTLPLPHLLLSHFHHFSVLHPPPDLLLLLDRQAPTLNGRRYHPGACSVLRDLELQPVALSDSVEALLRLTLLLSQQARTTSPIYSEPACPRLAGLTGGQLTRPGSASASIKLTACTASGETRHKPTNTQLPCTFNLRERPWTCDTLSNGAGWGVTQVIVGLASAPASSSYHFYPSHAPWSACRAPFPASD